MSPKISATCDRASGLGTAHLRKEHAMTYQTINSTNNELIKTCPNHADADIRAAPTTAQRLHKSSWL
jgi:hypothetical protein